MLHLLSLSWLIIVLLSQWKISPNLFLLLLIVVGRRRRCNLEEEAMKFCCFSRLIGWSQLLQQQTAKQQANTLKKTFIYRGKSLELCHILVCCKPKKPNLQLKYCYILAMYKYHLRRSDGKKNFPFWGAVDCWSLLKAAVISLLLEMSTWEAEAEAVNRTHV